ncbi:hypothetical protein NE237_016914 [Protea cynaroides]|uniref:Uncharacterized protein n=1 Tax=Protea cynaroides TaxID=273540 RepID=A0A9Q0HI19_9MAGN|nr:hypothetical protein NE237_016914 [Protea cynaroides]
MYLLPFGSGGPVAASANAALRRESCNLDRKGLVFFPQRNNPFTFQCNFSSQPSVAEELNLRHLIHISDHKTYSCRGTSSLGWLVDLLGQVTITAIRQSITQGNEDKLQTREIAAFAKAKELCKLLEEASTEKFPAENGELSDSEKDYDLQPKIVKFSVENGNGRKEEHMFEIPY